MISELVGISVPPGVGLIELPGDHQKRAVVYEIRGDSIAWARHSGRPALELTDELCAAIWGNYRRKRA